MYKVVNGLATLGPAALEVQTTLDGVFLGWARECDAAPHQYPALVRVADLARLDYFVNFPHLSVLTAGLRQDVVEQKYAKGLGAETVPAEDLGTSSYALPSATCYGAYLDMAGSELAAPRRITAATRCFRNEVEFNGLRRLWGFLMREIVCVGDQATVQSHLKSFKARIIAFGQALELGLRVEVATDPFFDKKTSRAALQVLFPVKEEFVYGESLAIASVNFHRNFFGERCQIALSGGEAAFSGCVAFGIERWLHALSDRFGADPARICGALERAARQVSAAAPLSRAGSGE